jgi:hypothetical protein
MMKHSKELKELAVFLVCASFFFIFIGTVTVQAATYYVATTGNDSNPGTSASPWRNPQRCTAPPVAAGDTCTVADGTYTDVEGNGIVVYVSGSSVQGTAASPITIKSTNPLRAHIIVPGLDTLNAGFYIGRNYYIIEGFDISGGTSSGSNASHHGISIAAGTTGVTVRKNSIHNIGRTICSDSGFGYTGVLTEGDSVLIEKNMFFTIGRLRNGENGCSTSMYQNDHGIYMKGGANNIIRYNVFYDTNRGWPIHMFGGTVTNLSIFNNTLSGKSPTGLPAGQIMLASTITTAKIKNNISYNPPTGFIAYYSLNASAVDVSHNLSDGLEKIATQVGMTFSNNLQNTNPGFVNAAGNDFHLTSGSASIDAGTNVGYYFNAVAPDIGAYEFPEQELGGGSPGGGSASLAPPQNLQVQ